MEFIALISALAAVIAIIAWKVPGTVVTMHKNALDHRYRTMQLQDETDGNVHRRFLEMQDASRDIPPAELEARLQEAGARKADAEVRRITAEREADTRRELAAERGRHR
jgi:hypothetical protein